VQRASASEIALCESQPASKVLETCIKEDEMIYSILVGLIAGWLAGQVMKGGGYGVLMDILLGLLGGIIGGWLFGSLGIWPAGGIVGSIVVSFVGAVILVGLTRMLRRA
jgi:uncharacterized membrane protein YeaQ/YmgE (transglycosylase-associated protein family)